MKTIALWIIAVTGLSLSGFCLFRVLAAPKLGIVDNAVLLQQFSEAIKAREEFQVEEKKWQANTKSIEDSLKAAMQAMSDPAIEKSPAAHKAAEARMMKWNKEYSDYTDAVRRMGPKLEADKLTPVLNKLNVFVVNWGKEHGYDAIYGTGTGGVILMRDPRYDVTTQVLSELNLLYKPETAVAAKDTSVKTLAQGKTGAETR